MYSLEKMGIDHIDLEFDCGEPSINDYFPETAMMHQETENTKVYVLISKAEETKGELIGFFTLSMTGLHFEIDGEAKKWGLTLLGMMGVNLKFQKQKFGHAIIEEAKAIVKKMKESIACKGILLETYFPKQLGFFKSAGFEVFDKKESKGRPTKYKLFCCL